MSDRKAEVAHLIRELNSRYAIPRKKAVDALVEIGTPAVVGLINTLKDKNPDVQASAAEALERIGSRVAKAAADGWRHKRGERMPKPEPERYIGEDATI
jgi:HEAT repeat protein